MALCNDAFETETPWSRQPLAPIEAGVGTFCYLAWPGSFMTAKHIFNVVSGASRHPTGVG